jgi:hypothetical protein
MVLLSNRGRWWPVFLPVVSGALVTLGCYNTPVDTSEYARGPAPLRMPSPAKEAEGASCYEDSLTGGHIFEMYCSACHNARSLAERPFSNYKTVETHMRVRANLTGQESAELLAWLRRWHDVPPPNPPLEPSPKRITFSQPLQELRPQQPAPTPPDRPQPDAAGAGAESTQREVPARKGG